MTRLVYAVFGGPDPSGRNEINTLWVREPEYDFRKPVPRQGESVILVLADFFDGPVATVDSVYTIAMPSGVDTIIDLIYDVPEADELQWLQERGFSPLKLEEIAAFFGVLDINKALAERSATSA
ncbi:MAG TPA: hypothetical protein VLE72_03370 [Candidatus Saccharimonadales bacterium]|nr:hypothetical protein [Candidatus Saccharimonadales bacterium]